MDLESKVSEAMSEIKRGATEFIGEDYIEKKVRRFYESGERFILKTGFDPTAPDIHLGHSVLLQKMAVFQKFGARVKFLIGDFTATIGDPSGKSETRKILSREEVLKNAETYKEQVFKILDPSLTDVCFNSAWINELGSAGFVNLTTKFSVARMIERDDFTKRLKENRPISMVEFIYPLLQGYDSVALRSDIELGGNDQKFNLLMGRSLQRAYGLDFEQSVLTMPLLVGLDGVNKMSKSLGNYIGVTESPNNMYAKLLSISDSLMWVYYELLSSLSLGELESLRKGVEKGEIHPKTAKENLALEIVEKYHGEAAAKAAKAEFDSVFSKNELPSDMAEFKFDSNSADLWIARILVETKLTPSTSQARREINAGAVKINAQKISDEQLKLTKGEFIIQIGKRKFAKISVF